MTIIPSYANVVAFFGESAYDRLAPMLRYFQVTLNDHSWQDFLFLVATPSSQGAPPLPADLPAVIRERCVNGCGDPNYIIYKSTADAIHRMYKNARLNLHIICDDFASGLFPAQAPTQLVRVLSAATHINIVPYFYFLVRSGDPQATQRQYQLAKAIAEDPELSQARVYLLSVEQDDNSLAMPETLWRALTCEILTISADKRRMLAGAPISLGYTSLNANEQELTNLQRQHLIELMRERSAAPYTPDEAWRTLLGSDAPPYSENEADARENVRRWLLARIHQDLPPTTPTQLNNFRILSGALLRQEPDPLYETAQRFFSLNLQAQASAIQDGHSQPYHSARQYLGGLLKRLCAQPNLADFPSIALARLLSCLQQLCADRHAAPAPTYPKKPFLAIGRNLQAYMLQCSQIAEDAALRRLEESLISVYAQAYGQMFTHVRGLIKSVSPLGATLDSLALSPSVFSQLQQKYPSYDQDIVSCLNRYYSTLLRDVRPYEPTALAPNRKELADALDNAVNFVRENMSSGFNSSFINAIKHEFDSADELRSFFDRYLNNQRRMFRNIHEAVDTPVITLYANHELAELDWTNIDHANLFLVRNDNVERLDYFPLQHPLADYLTEEAQNDPNNLYFRRQSDDAPDLPMEPADGKAAFALPEEMTAAPELPDNGKQDAEKPPLLRLIQEDKQWLLQWPWDPAVQFYNVRINGADHATNAALFAARHGFDITSWLVPGRNEITLSVLGGTVVATETFCGPKRPIAYEKSPTSLRVACPAEYLSQLFVRENVTVRGRDGKPAVRPFYYPLGATEAALENLPLVYTGLSFSGDWELVCHPSDSFPKCEPQQRVNL